MKKTLLFGLCLILLVCCALPVCATETSSTEASSTETTAGETTPTETVCQHSYGQWQPLEGNLQHCRTCSSCGNTETADHNWTLTTDRAATCSAEGEKTYVCDICTAEKKESVAKAEHNFGQWTKDENTHKRTCQVCSAEDPASGNHQWDNGVETQKPTCESSGRMDYTCKVCGEIRTREVPGSHIYDNDCDDQCNVCKKTRTVKHTYDNECDADCNSCGKARSVKHTYGSSWSRDYSGHWHECTKCGDRQDFKAHYPGPAATEEEPQVCVTCDYVLAQKLNHVHNYEKEWSEDETGHWYACKGCEVVKDFAKHTFKNACDIDCDVCGFKKETGHTYDANAWETTDREHWAVCSVCGEASDKEKHIPGPEATEEEAQLCTVCGYEIAPKMEHTHAFGPDWQFNEENHWQNCACGEASVPAPHTWDEGTEVRNKSITYNCTQCDAQRTETLKRGFPWWILIVVLLLLGAGGAAAYVFLIMPRQEEAEDEEAVEEVLDEVFDEVFDPEDTEE